MIKNLYYYFLIIYILLCRRGVAGARHRVAPRNAYAFLEYLLSLSAIRGVNLREEENGSGFDYGKTGF